MHNDENIHVTATNSADENHGSFLGIDLRNLTPVLILLGLGFGIFAWLQYHGKVTFSSGFWIILFPAVVSGIYVAVFSQGRHASYAEDLLDTATTGGHALPPLAKTSARGSGQPADGWLIKDLIITHGMGPGGQVSKGFWLDLQDISHASAALQNAFQEKLSKLPFLVGDEVRIQMEFSKDGNYGDSLLRQQTQSQASPTPAIKHHRNRTFLKYWNMKQAGQLRRNRVAIFLGRPFNQASSAPWKKAGAEGHYETVLAQTQAEFAEHGTALANLVASMGGTATPMTDADHYRFHLEKFNPSLARRNGFDAMDGFNPARSILETCWHSELRGQAARGFWMDEFHHGVLVLKHWPLQTIPGMANWLTLLPFADYTISVQMQRMPLKPLLRQLQREADRIGQQLLAKPNEHLAITKTQLEERIRRLLKGSETPLLVEYILIIRATSPEQLSERMMAAKSAIHSMRGANYHEATLAASSKQWFLKTLPGGMFSRHRGVQLFGEATFVADLLPVSSSFTAHLSTAEALYLGTHGNLIGIKTFAGDGRDAMPQNMLVVGSPGMGKSVFLSDLLFQTAPFYEYTVIIEEGLSHAAFTKAMGCVPIIVTVGGGQSFNILGSDGIPMGPFLQSMAVAFIASMVGLSSDADQARYRTALIAKRLASLCREFAQDQIQSLSETKRTALIRKAMAIQQFAEKNQCSFLDAFVEWRDRSPEEISAVEAGFSEGDVWAFQNGHSDLVENLVYSILPADRQLTLSAFKDHLELSGNDAEGQHCQKLATLLEPYCGNSRYGAIFDRPTNVSLKAPVLHLELGGISEADKELKAMVRFVILTLVRQHLLTLPKLSRKRLIIEELSRFLELGGEALVLEFFNQFRKHRTQLTVVLQNFTQIASPALRAAIIGGTPAYVIFNPGDRNDLAVLGESIGLSAAAKERILKYARPSHLTGRLYSECTYVFTDPNHPICGTIRFTPLPDTSESTTQPPTPDSHAK